MTLQQLFNTLDLDGDGALSRADLHGAARRLGWHWSEAPLYAVLDLLTVRGPLSRGLFVERMTQIVQDRRGPYGEVLLCSPRPEPGPLRVPRGERVESTSPGAGEALSAGWGELLDELDRPGLEPARAALLIIDPQRSFTEGSWMRSMGPHGQRQVQPIQRAFAACAQLLASVELELVLTRCPFPPGSYDWDDAVGRRLPSDQVYFVKPGNSALWPPTNGYAAWLDGLVQRGKQLVIGGCTLNSCVRVTALETRRQLDLLLDHSELSVMVDLSLCGARVDNYAGSPMFDGRSSVESAVRQMQDAGVEVVQRVEWSAHQR